MSQMEEEQDPEERDQFLQQLYKFMEDRGQIHVYNQGEANESKPSQTRCDDDFASFFTGHLVAGFLTQSNKKPKVY